MTTTVENLGAVKGIEAITMALCTYFGESMDLRAEHEDISNLDFHRRFGFSMQIPEHWDVMYALSALLITIGDYSARNMLIVYSTSVCYKNVFATLGDDATYISWHEIHTAMQISASDPSYIRRIRELLDHSDLTVVIDLPSTFSDVLNQIRASSSGCLIPIGSKT